MASLNLLGTVSPSGQARPFVGATDAVVGPFSVPGSGANSERFGGSATIGNVVGALALGHGATIATGATANSIAIGLNSTITASGGGVNISDQSLGVTGCVNVGLLATCANTLSVSVGQQASTSGNGAIAIGRQANASSSTAIAIGGNGTTASGSSSIAMLATVAGTSSIGIGSAATASGNTAIAVGDGSGARVTGAVVIGSGADVNATATANSICIGFQAGFGASGGGVNIGTISGLNFTRTTIVGILAQVGANDSTAIGHGISTSGTAAVAIGRNSTTGTSANCVAVGESSTIGNVVGAIAIGRSSTVTTGASGNSIAIGSQAIIGASGGGVLIGNQTINFVDHVVIGLAATVGGVSGVAVGQTASTGGDNATAVGSGASSTGANSTAIGASAVASATGGSAFGNGANTHSVVSALALGRTAVVTAGATTGSIAIGQGSNVDSTGGGITIGQGSYLGTTSGVVIGSSANIQAGATSGSIAIGSSTLINAAGGGVVIGNATLNNTGCVIIGIGATAGSNINSTAVGASASASDIHSAAFGKSASSNGGGTAIGALATAGPTNSVAVGFNNIINASAAASSIAIGGNGGGFGATGGGVNIGGGVCNYLHSTLVGTSTTVNAINCTVVGYNATSGVGATRTVVIGYLASVADTFTDTVAIGGGAIGGLRSITIGPDAHSTGNDDVCIGPGAASFGAGTIALGEACASNGFGNLAIGISSDANGVGANCIGASARNYYFNRITHAQTYQDNTFVSGHLGTEMNNVYFGAGLEAPTTTGRFATAPPNAVIRGTNGYFFTTIPNPENFAASGTAPTATGVNAAGGTLTPAQTFKLSIGYANKERAGETLLNSPYAVTVGGGHNAIKVQNLNAGAANVQDGVNEQIEFINIYMEDTPGSGNLYLVAVEYIGNDVTILAPPSNAQSPGYLALVSQVASNTTASDGTAWSFGIAGANAGVDSTVDGGLVFLRSGLPRDTSTATSGAVNIFSADTDSLTSESTGLVSVRTGNASTTATSGALSISTGTGNVVGNITISTPAPGAGPGNGGQIRLDCAGDGITIAVSPTQLLAFWGASPAVQQAVAALTNNVTAGGTDDVIDNFTSLTSYATDASTIRNDIYQLARKVKEITDALRTIGILG